MAVSMYAVTVTSSQTNATFTRTLPATKIKAFRQKAESEGYVIRSSRPVRG